MDSSLKYCPDLEARLERLRLLYTHRRQDRILARMEVETNALRKFAAKYPPGYVDCPELAQRSAFWDELLAERAAIHDDSIPSAYLSEMDQGLYGGIVGGKVQFMAHPENGWISSMVPPILKDWAGFRDLQINRHSPSYDFYLQELALFHTASDGKFGISHFILIDSLNFVFELFGATQTYLEMIDRPDQVREAIEFAYQLNVEVQRTFFQYAPLLAGGTCSNMVEWIPGRIVSESVDPFHMTSVKDFEKWGREPVERILATFDGGVVHIHANGRHLLEAVSTVRGLKAAFLADDLHFPSAFSILGKLRRRLGDLPVVVSVEFPDFAAALESHTLEGGVFYKVQHVPDIETANRIMDQVREYTVRVAGRACADHFRRFARFFRIRSEYDCGTMSAAGMAKSFRNFAACARTLRMSPERVIASTSTKVPRPRTRSR